MIALASSSRIIRKVASLLLILPLLILSAKTPKVQADSLSSLQQQQAQLQQQAAQAAQQAEQQKTLAQRAADSLQQASSQISTLNGTIQDTQSQIGTVQQQMDQKNQEIAALESTMRTSKDQQNSLVRQLYVMTVSEPDNLALLSNQSLSDRSTRQEQLNSLEKATTASYYKTQQDLAQVTAARDDLQQKNANLVALQSQQQDQKRVLADTQSTQQALRNNAEVAEQQLEAKAAAAKAQAAQIAQRIRVLTTTSNWGNQIVSSDSGGWYYTQTGDYTLMGNGPYTVSEVGCYITSIAMVATYYGHHITPDYIAQNGVFSDGYLVSLPPTGVTLHPSGRVNWSTVNAQISENHPVIVSIYLPSVGAVNSDGSSHFVVIKGVQDGKYLMQDPIGHGRSYNLNQVRSMILVTPN